MVETARTFDDKLSALKDLFELPPWRFWPNKGWPCRLKKVEDRPQAMALLDELERLLAVLRRQAPGRDGDRPGSARIGLSRADAGHAGLRLGKWPRSNTRNTRLPTSSGP